MGLDTETARFLLSSRRDGASFRRCVTLGRQNYFLGNREAEVLLRENGIDPAQFPKLFAQQYSRYRYSEDFWEVLGTEELVMLDASSYEGATWVHDLNRPIPDDWHRRFDAVCDLGTLEHVFHLPVALKNCMEMVDLGGHLFLMTPANNFLGHGFYQFSPELFHRVLCEANGYCVERMVAVEYGPRRRWYEVADPARIRARVALINTYPVMLFVRARRTAMTAVLRDDPQQSDCSAQWSNQATPAQSGEVDRLASARLDRIKRLLLERFPRLARALEGFRYSTWNPEWTFRNRRSFTPVPRQRR
ncbi:MAG: hypothetical protein KF833_01970 [Verrucomicrobiae bacterium]|nr:hypothetical protein [Verrucomicrobiae bacterium]